MTGPTLRTKTNRQIEQLCARHQFEHDAVATAELLHLLRQHPDDLKMAAAHSPFVRNVTEELRLTWPRN